MTPSMATGMSMPLRTPIDKQGGSVVSKWFVVTASFVVVVLGMIAPVYAQGPAGAAPATAGSELVKWSIITSGFALGIAAAFGALGQARAVAAAVKGIARNPAATNDIRGNLILGLVLIESLVIYVLLVSLILFFIKPFGG